MKAPEKEAQSNGIDAALKERQASMCRSGPQKRVHQAMRVMGIAFFNDYSDRAAHPNPIADWMVQHTQPSAANRPAFADSTFTKSYYYSLEPSFIFQKEARSLDGRTSLPLTPLA